MSHQNIQYPKDATNSLRRHRERGDYSLETIHGIIQASQFVHVSFTTHDSPFPATLPMIGTMGSFEDRDAGLGDYQDLYLHGYISHRIMNSARTATGDEGMPVTVAASHVDGIVLALSAFSHSYNYQSAILFGYATPVEDEAEKLYAMEIITNKVVPGRWENTRLPLAKADIQSTGILKVRIKSGSAKIRRGQASDERRDMKDEEALNRVWAGVVPVSQVMGEPVPSPYNRVDVPSHVSAYIRKFNETGEDLVSKSYSG